MIDLMNGDCLELMQTIPDNSIDAIITDPPYGTTACRWDIVIDFDLMWEQLNRIIKPNGAIVLFGSEPFSSALRMSNIKSYKYDWIWNKKQGTGFLNSKKQPLRQYEIISVFYSKQCTYNPQMRQGFKAYTCKQGNTKTKNYGKQTGAITISNGDRYPINIIDFNRDKEKIHPTQKPVALLEYLINTYTNEGEMVLDFTAGSFTAGIACLNTKRDFIGIEKDDDYFKIGTDRINKHLTTLN
jgi:site-specific DNA-methyltransferase (adenine-specific)